MTSGAGLRRKTPMKPGTMPMKRSPFKRSSKQTLHRAAMKAGTTRLRPRTSSPRPESTFRSPALLAAVRQLPCMCCGIAQKTQAAHSNQLRFGKGRGLRGSDAAIMALCSFPAVGVPGCHEKHDQGGQREKLEAWAFEYAMISRTLMALIVRRRLVGDPELLRSLPIPKEDLCVALVEHIEAGRLTVAPNP